MQSMKNLPVFGLGGPAKKHTTMRAKISREELAAIESLELNHSDEDE